MTDDVIIEVPDADIVQVAGVDVHRSPRRGITSGTEPSDLAVPDPLGVRRTDHEEVAQQLLGSASERGGDGRVEEREAPRE